MVASSVCGSAAIRHATYNDEGVRLGRHCTASPTALIPLAYVALILAPVLKGTKDAAALTGVTFDGQNKPVVVSLTRSPDMAGDAVATNEFPPPCCGVGSGRRYELPQCTVCDRLFSDTARRSVPPYTAPLPVVVLPVAGTHGEWARPVARDKEVLDDTAVLLITQCLQERAPDGGKTKCSATTALQRLFPARQR